MANVEQFLFQYRAGFPCRDSCSTRGFRVRGLAGHDKEFLEHEALSTLGGANEWHIMAHLLRDAT